MHTCALKNPDWMWKCIGLVLVFTMLVSACSLDFGGDSGSSSPPASTPRANAQPTPVPTGIQPGVEPCPDAVKDQAHWHAVVDVGTGQTVEHVLCGHLMGTPALQAVVTVRHAGASRILDVHIYTNITKVNPTSIFTRRGLSHGDARISGNSTILTAEAERQSRINAHRSEADLTQDLFREFKWSTQQGNFVQVAFPGIYPDLTRYQAEVDQARVNQGQDLWKRIALVVARSCVIAYLKWGPTTAATPLIGGNDYDLGELVQVTSGDPGTGTVNVTLCRLEGNAKDGIWIVQDLEADGMSITSPTPLSQLTSPVTMSGRGHAVAGRMGTAVVLDHQLIAVGETTVTSGTRSGPATFSVSVTYTTSVREGAEEGLVIFYASNVHGGPPAMVVTVKVLLSAHVEEAPQGNRAETLARLAWSDPPHMDEAFSGWAAGTFDGACVFSQGAAALDRAAACHA